MKNLSNVSDAKLPEVLASYLEQTQVIKNAEQRTSGLFFELVIRRNRVTNILLETKKGAQSSSDDLVYPWVHGVNHFQTGGKTYSFKFNEEDWKVENIELVSKENFEEKEVQNEQK